MKSLSIFTASCAALLMACTSPAVEGDLEPGAGKADNPVFEPGEMNCVAGDIEFAIDYGGQVPESDLAWGKLTPDAGNRIRIRRPGVDDIVYDTNVLFSTDGAGNDTYQVLFLDSSGYEFVVHLYFDHEGGEFTGSFKAPIYQSAEEFFGGPPNTFEPDHQFLIGFEDRVDVEGLCE